MKKLTKDEWVSRAKEIHGDRYDYTQAEYTRSTEKLKIICNKHQQPFYMVANCHIGKQAQGCPICAREATNKALELRTNEARLRFSDEVFKKHGDLIDVSGFEYKGSKVVGTAICREHGEFSIKPNALLTKVGAGCPKCGIWSDKKRMSLEVFESRFKVKHPDYVLVASSYSKASDPVSFICPEHGEVSVANASSMLSDNPVGCPLCAQASRIAPIVLSTEEKLERFTRLWGGKYTLVDDLSARTGEYVEVSCNEHGVFRKKIRDLLSYNLGCPSCTPTSTSRMEGWVADALEQQGFEVRRNDRTQLKVTNKRSKELDIFLPEYGLGIELDGLYWHREDVKGTMGQLNKRKAAEGKGVELLQFFEDEVRFRYVAVLNTILMRTHRLKPIHARKCELKVVDYREVNGLYELYHLQGGIKSGSKHFGLYYGGELVAAATFGDSRFRKGEVELLRWCCTNPVVGGLSKILKNSGYDSVVSYQDLRMWNGKGYAAAGFEHLHNSRPGYFWVKGGERVSRFKCRGAGERVRMESQGYYRVWDCGQAKWRWTRK